VRSHAGLASRTAVLALLILALAPVGASALPRRFSADLVAVEDTAAVKLGRTDATTPLDLAPFYVAEGVWKTTELTRWNSGFLPGSLWFEYQRSGEASWATAAKARQARLDSLVTYRGTPDIACISLNSHVRAYRLTGDARSKQLALVAAENLAKRYSPIIGMARAHGTGTSFRTIVDQLMNTELLFWAADNGGNPAWRSMATSNTVRTALDFQRPDGGTYHFATYDTTTGALLDRGTIQGYSADSTWSRGQAWFIYGMTAGFRETGDVRLLNAVRRAVDYWESRVPADKVPYWDFDDPAIPSAPRDSSAAAITASALIELSTLDPDPARRVEYRALAEDTLESLSSDEYMNSELESVSVLDHGTYLAARGWSDHGTIWGDYFFREALMRLGTRAQRVDGTDRYQVAVRACQLRFATANTVVLTSGEEYADGLSASSLAGLYNAPILLTRAKSIPKATLAEIARLGADRVVIVGGPGTVGDEVFSAVDALSGVDVERISGANRYDVAAKVAAIVLSDPSSSGRVFVARGDGYADALAVSPLAWSSRSPVLLTRPTDIPRAVRSVLASDAVRSVVVVGGEGSVSEHELEEIEELSDVEPTRVGGKTRFDTASELAEWAVRNRVVAGDTVGIATGAGFPDALASGAAMGSVGGVILLTEPDRLTGATRDWLRAHRSASSEVTIYGGPATIREPVESYVDRIVTFGR